MSLFALVLATLLQSSPAPLETVAHDAMSGIQEPRQAVARAAEEWATLWRAHAGDRPSPRVDFSTTMVLAVFLGSRPSSGYSVEVVSTRAVGNGLVVTWSERRPAPDMMSAQVLTSPAHIVAVPKVAGVIRFEKAGR